MKDWQIGHYQGQMVVSPYVGMVWKQNDGSNGCINNFMTITWLVLCILKHFSTSFDCCPRFKKTPKSSISNAKVAKRQPAKTKFCHLLFFSFLMYFSQASILTPEAISMTLAQLAGILLG